MIIHLMMITAFSLKLEVDARSPKKNKKTGTALVESNGNILIDDRVHNMASQSSTSSTPNASSAAAPSRQDIHCSSQPVYFHIGNDIAEKNC